MRTPAPIAVTGIGVVSSLGFGREQFWNALFAGRSGIAPLETVVLATAMPTVAAEVRGFAPREFIASANLRRMGKLSRLVVAASRMALDDARFAPGAVDPTRLGVFIGTALADIGDSAAYLGKLFSRGAAAASPLLFPNLVLNAAASYVAMELDATGVNLTVAQGEISGEQAVIQACEALRAGQADAVLAGGGDEIAAIVADIYFAGHSLAGQRGGAEWSSPYDRDRSGVVLGEGAAVLMLEPLDRARSRGAAIAAVIEAETTFAESAPPYDWPAKAATSVDSVRRLLGGRAVDLAVGSANSTRRLDAGEIDLFSRLFGSSGSSPTITSIKGAIGEFGAAGATTIAAACLALRQQGVPPLAALHTPAAGNALRFAAREGSHAELRRVLVCGFARGGAGAALLLRRA